MSASNCLPKTSKRLTGIRICRNCGLPATVRRGTCRQCGHKLISRPECSPRTNPRILRKALAGRVAIARAILDLPLRPQIATEASP